MHRDPQRDAFIWEREGGDSKLRPKSEGDAAMWLWGQGSTHSGRSSKGQPRGKDSAWPQGGTETGTAGTGAKPGEEGRIPQASWAWLLAQERVVELGEELNHSVMSSDQWFGKLTPATECRAGHRRPGASGSQGGTFLGRSGWPGLTPPA